LHYGFAFDVDVLVERAVGSLRLVRDGLWIECWSASLNEFEVELLVALSDEVCVLVFVEDFDGTADRVALLVRVAVKLAEA